MKQLINIAIIIVLVLTACSEPINVDLRNEKTNRLVVEGSITNELKVQKVVLSRTGAFQLNDRTQRELGATVTITDGETVINLYDENNDGVYLTENEVAGEVNHTYTLNVTLKNGESYSASEKINPVPEIQDIRCNYEKTNIEDIVEEFTYNLEIDFVDPMETQDCYQWEIYIDNVHKTDTLSDKPYASDKYISSFMNFSLYNIDKAEIKKDKVDLKIKMLSISEAKYNFYFEIGVETDFRGSLFDGPPANVSSNISNGALGFFSASAVSEKTITVERQHIPDI